MFSILNTSRDWMSSERIVRPFWHGPLAVGEGQNGQEHLAASRWASENERGGCPVAAHGKYKQHRDI